jgi:hypothetical protein
MALFDTPPHAVATYSVSTARDAGGGEALTYTLAQSAVPCSINTASAATQELFAQQNIRVTLTVAFLSSVLTTAITRGFKLVAADTGASLKVEGIRAGRAYGRVPAFVYCDCSELL